MILTPCALTKDIPVYMIAAMGGVHDTCSRCKAAIVVTPQFHSLSKETGAELLCTICFDHNTDKLGKDVVVVSSPALEAEVRDIKEHRN